MRWCPIACLPQLPLPVRDRDERGLWCMLSTNTVSHHKSATVYGGHTETPLRRMALPDGRKHRCRRDIKASHHLSGMRAHLEAIAPANLLSLYEFNELPHVTRYLHAMMRRAQRAKESIQRDIDKSKRIAPFEAKLKELEAKFDTTCVASLRPYRILLEEFKVSIYAQELGTAQKVSEKRLEELAETLQRLR